MQNLQLGSAGHNVLQLQQFLQSQGLYNGKLDGVFGPQTAGAVQVFQGHANLKQDGIVGPKTSAAISGYSNPVAPNTPGNYSNTGFDPNQVTSLDNESMSELAPYYDQERANNTFDTTARLKKDQSDYNAYLQKSASDFNDAKNTQDLTSAKNGVLFSTGRVKNLSNLENSYANDQAKTLADYTSDIGTTANDYQYRYGNDAASGLSQYYGLGGNTYNAQGSTPVVGSNGISSVYNPSISNYFGTQKTDQAYQAANRTAGKLQNKANKGLLYGYKNQF